MDLRNKRVLVTGASGGLGAALVMAVAARGARVTLTGRRHEVLTELAARVGGTPVAVDLSEPDAPSQLLESTGPIDVLIANAALPASGLLSDYSVEQIDRALDVNLRAPIVLAKLAGAEMAARGAGHLVFISSLSGKSAASRMALYNATKFGVRGFALAIREDLRPSGVGVSVILPGPIRDAGMIADARVELPRVATRTSSDVADATVRAIERNRAEIVVAPWSLRIGAMVGSVAPSIAAAVTRRTGGDGLMAALSEGQRDKR